MSVRKHILYITYIDITQTVSGSSVRPYKMYQAMLEEGHEVLLLAGNQLDKDRPVKTREVIDRLSSFKPDLCYIESPTYPIMRRSDRCLIKTVCKHHIPTGYFYRDFYRRFPELVKKPGGISRYIKDIALDYLQRRTDSLLRVCDLVYLPSEKCKELFSYHRMKALPPGGENLITNTTKSDRKVCIYVGGITGLYDGRLLLDAFHELNSSEEEYKLLIVCREKEWAKFEHREKTAPWLEVHHVSSDTLEPLYRRAALSLIIHKDVPYNHYAVPVKTFEYMSHGLPIVSVNLESVSKIIQDNQIGVVVNHQAKAFAKGVQMMLASTELYNKYRNNVKNALENQNLWKHRVRTIIEDLTS